MSASLSGRMNTGREQTSEAIRASRVPQPSYTMFVSSTMSTSGRSPSTSCACNRGHDGPQNERIAAFSGSAANIAST